MVSRVKAGKTFMTLDAGRGAACAGARSSAGLDHVAALSSRGRLLVFALDEMREVPRGRGVIIMGLDGEERLTAVGLTTANRVVLQGTNRVGRTVVQVIEGEELAKHRLRRARKGSLVTEANEGARVRAGGLAKFASRRRSGVHR